MREIKFRAWDGEKMHINYVVGGVTFTNVLRVLDDEKFAQEAYGVQEWKIGQYIGLKDKNGVEIYEGDICASHNGAVMGFVVFQSPSFVIKKTARAKTWHEFILSPDQRQFQEVIGNIYEDSELLK